MADEALDVFGDDEGASAPASGGGNKRRGMSQVEFGKPDTMRHTVLSLVASTEFDRAIKALSDYVQLQNEYPGFEVRVRRYVAHCTDLINAVRAKKNLPGINMLSTSKQQELHDRVINHMKELGDVLKRMESIEREMKLDDARSTVWVINAFVLVATFLVFVVVINELFGGILTLSWLFYGDVVTDLTDLLFNIVD